MSSETLARTATTPASGIPGPTADRFTSRATR
jgi:hypothetical protein